MFRILKGKDYDEMSLFAANVIFAQITLKPDCVLGLATGSSPIGTYNQLIKWNNDNLVDFSQVTSVNLDEYVGLDGLSDQSYRYFMNHHLFNHVNIDSGNTYVPNGRTDDVKKECEHYDKLIRDLGGIDLQLLGLGNNGHIGFNEPADSFAKGTHKVDLTDSTIKANSRFFDQAKDVPTQALTMGIGNILLAEKILIVVSGEEKADIVKKAFFGPVTPQVPASILQLHKDVTLVGDEAALSGIG